jgi:hypothetical protein
MIVSEATIWSVTLYSSIGHLETVYYNHNQVCIRGPQTVALLLSIIYNCNVFIVHATGANVIKLFFHCH